MKFIISIVLANGLLLQAQAIERPKNSPLSILSIIERNNEAQETVNITFNKDWVDSLKLQLPCVDIPVPKRAMRLPNAPRDYRSGIHRGIDFFANWGTPVRAVADGIVIRSDLYYQEYVVEGSVLRSWKHKFLKRLNMYHELKFDEKEQANIQMKAEDFNEKKPTNRLEQMESLKHDPVADC